MPKRKKVPETINGQILAIPRAVKRSSSYISCSPLARALLIELADQHNGSNNGHLNLSYAHLSKHGFKSKDQIAKGRDELIKNNLIVQTRQGGLPVRNAGTTTFGGASWFALTWLHIHNFVGLDISTSDYKPGVWSTPIQVKKRDQPEALKIAQIKRKMQPVPQAGKDPCYSLRNVGADPFRGSKGEDFDDATVPQYGNNVIHHTLHEILKD